MKNLSVKPGNKFPFLFVAFTLACHPLSSPLADSGEPKRAMELMDLFKVEYPLAVEISATGEWVTFYRQRPDVMNDEFTADLWKMRTDGSGLEPIAKNGEYIGSLEWAPSGNSFAYVSLNEGAPTIFVHNADSGETGIISNPIRGFPSNLKWAQDSSKIAFTMASRRPAAMAITLPEAPDGAEWKDPPRAFGNMDYLFPDGSMSGGTIRQLYYLDVQTAEVMQATNSDNGIGQSFGWAPDGEHLVAEEFSTDQPDRNPFEQNIVLVDLEAGTTTTLLDRKGYEGRPLVSPDGKTVAFIGYDETYPGPPGYQRGNVFTIGIDGAGLKNLSDATLDRSVGDAEWSPDGSHLVILYDDHGITKLANMDLQGNFAVIVENLGSGPMAYPQGGNYRQTANGDIAFTYKDSYTPGAIAIYNAATSSTRVIPGFNSFLDGVQLGEVTYFDYQSSLDGLDLDGWYILPPDYDPTATYPAILEIHGGPFSNYGPRFDIEKQIYAAAGYIIVYANYRGSTGYGRAFGSAGYGAFPGPDTQDMIDAMNHIATVLPIDKDREYVVGGSAGGTLTAAVIARTDQFRAAVVLYPLADFASYVVSAVPWVEVMQATFPAPPWHDITPYFERSVLSKADEIHTPALLLTGGNDFQSPVFQTEALYRALKWEEQDTRLVIIPDETHGIRDHPSHFMAKLAVVMEWLEEHQ